MPKLMGEISTMMLLRMAGLEAELEAVIERMMRKTKGGR